MAGTLVGIDIGSKFTKACVFEQAVKLSLADGFLFATPLTVSKGGDKTVDPQAFLKELEKFIPAARLRHAKIAVNMPPMSIAILSVFLPLMSKRELLFAAVNEAKQKMIPVSGPNHIFECILLGETMINRIPRSEVLVIRTEKTFVQRLIDVFKPLDVFPRLITPPSTVLPLIVPHDAWKKDEGLAIVDLGAVYLKIALCSNNHMAFVRNVVYGLDDIAQDFSRQLNVAIPKVEEEFKERGIPNIPFDPKDKVAIAEEIMRQKYEASLAEGTPLESQINTLELRLLWQPHLEKIAQELRRSFVFYQDQSEAKKITRVFFFGGGSCLKNFLPMISSFVGTECEVLAPFSHVQHHLAVDNKFRDQITGSSLFASAASLGLALQVPKAAQQALANFLPQDLRQRETVAARRLGFLISAICFVGLFAALTINILVGNQMARSKIRAIDQKLSRVKRVSENLKVLEQSQGRVNQRSARIDELLKKRCAVAAPLKAIAAAMPDDLLLVRCTLTVSKLEMEGKAFLDYETAASRVALLKRGLERSGYFANVTIPESEPEIFSPQSDSGGSAGQLQLTAAKERKFEVTADMTGK